MILAFATVRNEAHRLPHWLSHYRQLGVDHFLIVDNASTDETRDILKQAPDVSVWKTRSSYRRSRFGMDWLTWLQIRYGTGHWCLTVDADELLIYPHHETRNLKELTGYLKKQGARSFGAMMLDMYPESHLGVGSVSSDDNPLSYLKGFDPWGYWWCYQPKYKNISIRGGVRERVFFPDNPDIGPHLHKIPLIWRSVGTVYISSTHIAFPRSLNNAFDARLNLPTGVLLHTKFLPEIVEKSAEEKQRAEHFTHTENYDTYYDDLIEGPILWHSETARFEDWRQLEQFGLMTRGAWQ